VSSETKKARLIDDGAAVEIVKWLKTAEGEKLAREAVERAREAIERLNKDRHVDPRSLQEPVTL
jgi:hypothetical protein